MGIRTRTRPPPKSATATTQSAAEPALAARSYEVGFAKPPKASQFQKGKSGNPKGRPKKKPEPLSELLFAELARELNITINGKTTKISAAKVIARQLVDRAAKGDRHYIALLIRFLPVLVATEGGKPGEPVEAHIPQTEVTSQTYAEVVAAYLASLKEDA